jgi:hypothetical protein
MVDDTIPVLIRFAFGTEETVCIARIVRDGDQLYGIPFLPAKELQPSRPRKISLDAHALELWPSGGGIGPLYHYRGHLRLMA